MGFSANIRTAEKHLALHDRRLAPIITKYGPCRLRPHKDYYAELVSSIVGQQLSAKAGDTIWRRVLDVFGGNMPTANQLIKVDEEIIRACGVSYAKIAYMKDLARHIIDGRLDMEHISQLPDEEITAQLTAVKGIGQWSADMFMIFSLGRLDVLPVGDLGIRKAAAKLYGLADLPNPQQLATISRRYKWKPYQSVASWYLWQSLENT